MNIAAIVNPHAGSGAAAHRWPGVARLLAERLGKVQARLTERPGHATEIARELAEAGCDLLIAAGGDGTLNEVVNGVLEAGAGPMIGVLPLASGGDFARTLGVAELATAIEVLAAGECRVVDVFRARFRGTRGSAAERWPGYHPGAAYQAAPPWGRMESCGRLATGPWSPYEMSNLHAAERYFVNTASFGMGARVAQRVSEGWPRKMPGGARYLTAAIPELASGKSYTLTLYLNDARVGEFEVTTVAAANGQYQGGGIRIAPEAVMDDGLMDVTVVERVSLADVAAHVRILYSGALYSHHKVRHWRAALLRAESDGDVPVELDGEPVGSLPIEIDALPGALRVVAPPRIAR